MWVVWKFPLQLQSIQKLRLPKGSEFLHAGYQPSTGIVLWYRCNANLEMEDKLIAICGTGHAAPAPITGKFLGTVFQNEFVWHLFEHINEEAADGNV